MTCLEHYFENLLLHGEDVANNANRNALTEDVRESVEYCAQYVIYVLFGNRKNFERWLKEEEDNTPTIDAVPVKHGEWSTYDVSGYRKCSMCGGYVNWNPKPFLFGDGEYNFCPNCGAKMDGRRDDDKR